MRSSYYNITLDCITIQSKEKENETFNKFKVKEEVRDNSRKLLKYSNMCLFKSLKTKYQCYCCDKVFIDITPLREHSKIHATPNISGNVYRNADISSLECDICSERCKDLVVLTNHLKTTHAIEFVTSGHMFIPYKLEEGFNCVICKENFSAFLKLTMHMNKHSTNHICETCGVSFFNSLNLRTHRDFQHNFSKKCTMCDEVFTSQYVKIKHMRNVHLKSEYKRYCVLCDKSFKYSYLLQEHKIKDHGVERQESKCEECGKTFLSAQNLKIHTRSVHVMERNYVCDLCGDRFFTKKDQVRHSSKHEDVKSFSCSNCDVRFKSKDSWMRHQRNKHDRFSNLLV